MAACDADAERTRPAPRTPVGSPHTRRDLPAAGSLLHLGFGPSRLCLSTHPSVSVQPAVQSTLYFREVFWNYLNTCRDYLYFTFHSSNRYVFTEPRELASESRDRQPAARLTVPRAGAGAGLEDGVQTQPPPDRLQPPAPPAPQAHSDHTASFSHLSDLILGAPAVFSASCGSQACNGVALVLHVLAQLCHASPVLVLLGVHHL